METRLKYGFSNYIQEFAHRPHTQQVETRTELPFYNFLEHLEHKRQWIERDVLQRLKIPRTT